MNTRRENRLEELGRVDAEKAHTSKGKRNLREEKDRIRSELATGGSIGKLKQTERKGGQATKPMDPQQKRRPRRKKQGPEMGPKPQRKKFIRDLKDYSQPRKPGDRPRIPDPRSPRPKKNRIMTPLGVRIKYSSGGAVMAGKKVGCQIK